MGFFDDYTDTSSGGAYVKEAYKDAVAKAGVPFPITKVDVKANPFEKDAEQWVLSVIVPTLDDDGELGDENDERLMAFSVGSVESRDRMLSAMAKWLEDPTNEPPVVKLEKVGRSWVLRKA